MARSSVGVDLRRRRRVQRRNDVAFAEGVPTKAAPEASPKLPHERDQTPAPETHTRAVMRQAYRDVQQGQVDTDARGAESQALAKRMRKS